MKIDSKKIWVVGSGLMAQAYCKVLLALGVGFEVVGRGEISARRLENEIGHKVLVGGVDKALSTYAAPEFAIVATGVEALEGATLSLLRAGAKSILTEKPGGMDVAALGRIHEATEAFGAKVFIAYNRRFYASVLKLRELIIEDGGIKSLQYDFTERSHVVRNLKTAIEIKERWFIANSTHVVDLAFHLGGRPKGWSAWHEGGLDWHPASSRFCGAGITDQNVLFNYSADWGAPGRWGLQVTTANRRFILRPLEEIKSFSGTTFEEEVVDIDQGLDLEFKPGIFLQTKAFLMAEEAFLCSAKEQFLNMKFYQRMAGYP